MSTQPADQASSGRFAPRSVRRKQLILSAIDSISENGLSGTTLKNVTDGANLSVGIVSYHFDSKEALYDATLKYLAEEHYKLWTKNMAAAGRDPARQLEAVIRTDFDPKICTPKKLAVWFAFWGQVKYRPNYMNIYAPFDGERFETIRKLCRTLTEKGTSREPDAERTARALVAQVDGSWLAMMLFPFETRRKDALADCLRSLALFFPGRFPSAQQEGGRAT